jgi:hypothetical protein
MSDDIELGLFGATNARTAPVSEVSTILLNGAVPIPLAVDASASDAIIGLLTTTLDGGGWADGNGTMMKPGLFGDIAVNGIHKISSVRDGDRIVFGSVSAANLGPVSVSTVLDGDNSAGTHALGSSWGDRGYIKIGTTQGVNASSDIGSAINHQPVSVATVLDGGGTLPCFAAGTRILTADGPVPVEQLALGDRIVTVGGTAEPIAWIGSRTVDCRRHPHPAQVRPILIRPHAFGPDAPSRDLFLSPDHAIYAEGVLIPVKHLICGDGIHQVEAGRVTYFHVELTRHNVIFAEGLAVETYLDTGDRAAFDDAAPALTLHPVFGDVALRLEAAGYAPLRVTGPEVAKVRARLADAQQPRAVVPKPGRRHPPRRA